MSNSDIQKSIDNIDYLQMLNSARAHQNKVNADKVIKEGMSRFEVAKSYLTMKNMIDLMIAINESNTNVLELTEKIKDKMKPAKSSVKKLF